MKFKVGDRLRILDMLEGESCKGLVTVMAVSYRKGCEFPYSVRCDCGEILNKSEKKLELIEEDQKMQNKNEWKIGCHTLSKTKCGSLIVTDQLGDKHLYRINRNEFGALKDFLSTPYQEEEVYVKVGDRLKYYGEDHIVARISNNSHRFDIAMVRLSDGNSYNCLVDRKHDQLEYRLADLIETTELAKWRVLPREGEK